MSLFQRSSASIFWRELRLDLPPPTAVVARLGINRPIQNWRNRLAFCHLFDGLIVNAAKTVDALRQTSQFNPGIVRVIHNGVPTSDPNVQARLRIRAELGLASEHFVIVGVGRLTPQKGFDMALDAFAELSATVPNVRLLLVGKGDGESDLRELAASLGVADRVVFTGFCEDVAEILQAADLSWITSRQEGMANVLLEAMAAGRASCAFDISGVREAISDGVHGRIIPAGATSDLSAATADLIASRTVRTSMEASARERVLTHFSQERMIENLERCLMEFSEAKKISATSDGRIFSRHHPRR